MIPIEGIENWSDAASTFGLVQEAKRVASKKSEDVDGPVAGYFGNTMVFRAGDGKIAELFYYRPDHTMRFWRNGAWTDGKWVVNSGQDSSKIFHTYGILSKPASFRHPFAPFKKVGDRWINPETSCGIPLVPGGIPVITINGKSVVADTGLAPGAMMSLEAGYVPAPAEFSKVNLPPDEQLPTVGENADKALEGYFGNTFYFRDDTGKIIEVIYYSPDHTVHSWRDGRWIDGIFLLNNGQDNSVICQTRADMFSKPATWCHPFAPFKRPGDSWVAPESHVNGDPVYPLIAAGIPVVTVGGKPVIVGTDQTPREIYYLERGHITLEELQSRGR